MDHEPGEIYRPTSPACIDLPDGGSKLWTRRSTPCVRIDLPLRHISCHMASHATPCVRIDLPAFHGGWVHAVRSTRRTQPADRLHIAKRMIMRYNRHRMSWRSTMTRHCGAIHVRRHMARSWGPTAWVQSTHRHHKGTTRNKKRRTWSPGNRRPRKSTAPLTS